MQKALGGTVSGHSFMKLSDVHPGSKVRIRRVSSRPEVSARLRELGLCENMVIRCVSRGHETMICEVYDTRIGMNMGLAHGIDVSEEH
jgi:Fe2+ transport system protein FeoA